MTSAPALSPAEGREEMVVHLWRRGAVGEAALAEFAVPVLEVPEASLHRGEVDIRRSPLLEVWSLKRSGVTRTDLNPEVARAIAEALALRKQAKEGTE